MSPSLHRIALAPGYILHHRPWRDTSRILEVLTREHGRFTLFARGVRGPTARLAPVLQPFQPLLLSWSGRGEAPQLTGAERAAAVAALPPGCLMAAFYLNELLLKLT
ncbi:MAG: DNA repair protein RecO, partial [Steroidobacteraceae bacterium]